MSTKYGIKFFGPRLKDIWWMSSDRQCKLSFDNVNDAYKWSDDATQRFSHCKYIVTEIPMAKKKKKKKPTPQRNPYVLPARMRKGAGTHTDKRKKRIKDNIDDGWK